LNPSALQPPTDPTEAYRAALAREPGNAVALNNLAALLQLAGRAGEAAPLVRRAAALVPDVPEVLLNVGDCLRLLRRSTPAASVYRRALALRSGFPEALNNLGLVLRDLDRRDEAAECFARAVEARPDYAEALNNLGNAVHGERRRTEARHLYRRATALKPDLAAVHANRGNAFSDHGDMQAALVCYRRSLALAESVAIRANLIGTLRLADGIGAAAELAECRRFARLHEAPLRAVAPLRARESRRLRVGYLGGDTFRMHTTATAVLPLIEGHDADTVEAVCYSDVPPAAADAVTRRFAAASRLVATAGLSDAALAERMRADGIDVAVDLVNYSRGSRLLALARRPAPVQANLLMLGTLGLDAVRWVVSDSCLTPEGMERNFSESVLRVDLAYVWQPLAPAPAVAPPPAAGGRPLTFGSFNQIGKLSPRCLAGWARLLLRVPNARLLLKARAFDDPEVTGRIRAVFAAHGVDSDRLELRGWTATSADHLDAYAEVDIALDTFPYGGVVTTCEAMWMGVPVVSLEDERVLGRYGVAFLRTLGLPELAAADEDAYVEAAAALAADAARLSGLRTGLRGMLAASRICDGKAFARDVEKAYRTMWQNT
jgi:predicted O-linked N-acetylglucosamine transferase (SPINDLY family)